MVPWNLNIWKDEAILSIMQDHLYCCGEHIACCLFSKNLEFPTSGDCKPDGKMNI